MFCKSCGAPISQDAAFCSACGTPVERQPVSEPSGYTAHAPAYGCSTYVNAPAPAPAPDASILIFGILSLALGQFGIFGIIFGAIAKAKANRFIAQGGVLSGGSKVGYILGTIGLIFGIVMTVFWIVWLVWYVAMVGSILSYGYYYY